jgi:hypothetical protein
MHNFPILFQTYLLCRTFGKLSDTPRCQGRRTSFAGEKFLNYSGLSEIDDARQHYLGLLCGLGFVDRTEPGGDPRTKVFDEQKLASTTHCSNSRIEQVVHSVVCAGLYGSKLQVLHTERKVLIDDWIELPVAAKTGVVIREIRNRLDD